MRPSLLLSCLLGCGSAFIHADKTGAHFLEEVEVKGQLMLPMQSAYSSTRLTQAVIREHSYANTDELFQLVPGMAVRNFQLGGVANSIIIRGFGNGGHGGDLGAVIDGIPLNEAMSHADGYVDLNVLVPLEIDTFTVIKGPVSALYGNFNRGGLVNIQTRKSGSYGEADLALGSDQLVDLQGAYGGAFGGSQLNAAAQYVRSDGFRPDSGSERYTVAGRWSMAVTPAFDVALSARLHSAEADSASYLTRAQFESDPYGIDPRVDGDGSEKDFKTLRSDFNYLISDHLKLLNFIYATRQEFTRWFTRPINASTWRQREEAYDRTIYGAGTSLNGETALGAVPVVFIAGLEGFRESTEFQFFDGLQHRQRLSPAASDRETDLNSVSAFTEVQASLHRLAQLSLGLRADRFSGGCDLRGPETGTDPCGSLHGADHVSPKIGLRSQISDHVELRASWAEGFALPNGFIKYSVGGQPLDENVFRQTEIGLRATALETLEFDIAAYRLTSTGEVRTVAPGTYENFGETLRRGVEAVAGWKPIEPVELRVIYGWTDTEVEKNADARLEGREVPGVPRQTATVEVNIEPVKSWVISAAWRYVGAYEIDALNTVAADSYAVIDLGLAYTSDARVPYRAYARIENVTDREYATTESIIGGQHLVAPGAPLSVRTGIQLNF